MPRKQHIVRLPRRDRRTLTRLVRTGRQSAWTLPRARILLLADAATEGPAGTDAAVAEAAVGVVPRTVARARAAWCAQGLACLTRQPQDRPSVPPRARRPRPWRIAALACTDPPPGFARWSLRQLTARVVEVEIVETICPETVRQALPKGGPAVAHRARPDPAGSGCQLRGGAGDRARHLRRTSRSRRAPGLLRRSGQGTPGPRPRPAAAA
ncbi:MAG: helix-turn-helix domain-containing protein, partial [Chloroflexia bacterium]|nr:helix-turn-helix domain-containing protein [Chloroflexia bacterium]